MDIVDSFVKKWNRADKTIGASLEEINEVEKLFQITLPNVYKYFLVNYGSVFTPNILDRITKKGLDLFDVQDFLLATELVEETEAHVEAGLPEGYIVFANDCMGNLFCFKLESCVGEKNEAEVWLFDHDALLMRLINSNFSEWLNVYNSL